MSEFIDFQTFSQAWGHYDAIPVARRLMSDSLSPVLAFHRLDDGGTACLFESVIGGEKVGRYSFLACTPHKTISASGTTVTLWDQRHGTTVESCANPIERLRELLRQVRVAPIPGLPPFTGGMVGYAAYDSIRYVERLLHPPHDDRQLPDLSYAFYDRMIVFDHITKTVIVIVLAWANQHRDPQAAYDEANARIDATLAQLNNRSLDWDATDFPDEPDSLPPVKANFSQDSFEAAVRRAIEYIQAGDIFQVVLSQRFEMPLLHEPLEIYRTLRVLNPSPFMFFLRTPEVTLVGSSPEIMCRVVNGEMTVRPLAGTRPRGKTPDLDRQLEAELLADPKERAEHVMLVDLGRNDVGRVAEFGSVAMPDLMVVERYSHVMHISSTVVGKLRPEFDAFDALMASLPAGTVSGAPKVRAMQIIDELEPHRRGPYAGAVGYIDYSDNMDTCIALRTMVIHQGKVYVQAGAGVVADSNPAAEYLETMNKARGLLKAIEMTRLRLDLPEKQAVS